MTESAYVDEDTPDQQARCRALEFAVLLRALLDATWRDNATVRPSDLTSNQRWLRRLAIIRRRAARRWFLDRDAEHRSHIEDIAAAAGLQDGKIWALVDMFVVRGENVEMLQQFQDAMSDRPAIKRLWPFAEPAYELNLGRAGFINGKRTMEKL